MPIELLGKGGIYIFFLINPHYPDFFFLNILTRKMQQQK